MTNKTAYRILAAATRDAYSAIHAAINAALEKYREGAAVRFNVAAFAGLDQLEDMEHAARVIADALASGPAPLDDEDECEEDPAAPVLNPLTWDVRRYENGGIYNIEACITLGGPDVRAVYWTGADAVEVTFIWAGDQLTVRANECPLVRAFRNYVDAFSC